jgi:CrcB protein
MARFVSDGLIRAVLGRKFPWGTLVINITGSFILGVVTGSVMYHHVAPTLKLIIGTGFCGGFTTFSTANFETVRLIEEHKLAAALFQLLANAGLCIAAAGAGIALLR